MHASRETQGIERAHHICTDRFNGVELVVDRRCRTGQIINLVHLEYEGVDDVVPDEFKSTMVAQILDIVFAARKEAVQADDLMALLNNGSRQMGADKSSASGD